MLSGKISAKIEDIELVYHDTDILIIGAGNAGCYAAIDAKRQNPGYSTE
ncbi:MAG TPA: hypothetical protein VMW83_10915 [Spirochaetia bacterium]|nr:hypothetical protein [Spirochaetia bacterium]